MPPPLTLIFFFFKSLHKHICFQSLSCTLMSLSPLSQSLFSISRKQSKQTSLISISFKFLRLHLSLFLSHTSVSLPPTKQIRLPPTKQIRQTGDGHGLSTKTNENNHFRLPTNNRLFSQRNRLISRYFVAIFCKEEINKPSKPILYVLNRQVVGYKLTQSDQMTRSGF